MTLVFSTELAKLRSKVNVPKEIVLESILEDFVDEDEDLSTWTLIDNLQDYYFNWSPTPGKDEQTEAPISFYMSRLCTLGYANYPMALSSSCIHNSFPSQGEGGEHLLKECIAYCLDKDRQRVAKFGLLRGKLSEESFFCIDCIHSFVVGTRGLETIFKHYFNLLARQRNIINQCYVRPLFCLFVRIRIRIRWIVGPIVNFVNTFASHHFIIRFILRRPKVFKKLLSLFFLHLTNSISREKDWEYIMLKNKEARHGAIPGYS